MQQEDPEVIFFTGHGRQGTTFAAHIFASSVDCFNFIENTKDPVIGASVTAYKAILPNVLREPSQVGKLERYFAEDPAWAAARESGLPVVCKFPWNTLIVPFLRTFFPRAHFIHVSRFPNDTVTSMKEVYYEHKAFNPVREHSIIGLMFNRIKGFEAMSHISRWANVVAYFDRVFLSSVDERTACLSIRYEDLLKAGQATETIRRMVDFSGLSIGTGASVLNSEETVNANQLYGGSGANHPTFGRVGRFARELSPSENREIYCACQEMIARDEFYTQMWHTYVSSEGIASDFFDTNCWCNLRQRT